jgi:hypothetical protein
MSPTKTFFASTINSVSPYREPITELLELLEDAEIITPKNKQQTIDIALNYLEDNSDFITIVWCADDVMEIATQRNLDLSKEDCLKVLKLAESRHDAELGINWLSLDAALDEFTSN